MTESIICKGSRVKWSAFAFQKSIPAKNVRYGYGTVLHVEPSRFGDLATVQWDELKHPKEYAVEFLEETFA